MSFQKLCFEASAYLPEQLLEADLPEIVFSGRSNVGKSSMINKLANRKALARVSSAPGKTASVNFYNNGTFRLVDLPGYGFAKVAKEEKEKWASLVEGYFAQKRPVALIVQLIDARHPLSADDADMLRYIQERGSAYLLVMTKTDKLKKTELSKRMLQIPQETGEPGERILYFSAQTGAGADVLEAYINRYAQQAGSL